MRKYVVGLAAVAAASILGITACGGGGTSSNPAASPTASASPTPSHTAQSGEPALIAVPGYDYANPPGSIASEAQAIINADPQHLKAASVHVVLHEGNEIAAIFLVQIQPQYANLPGIQQELVSSAAKESAGSGATVTQETIRTEKVVVARSDSTVGYAWYHADTMTLVAGENASEVRDFVGAYLGTAHATGALGSAEGG